MIQLALMMAVMQQTAAVQSREELPQGEQSQETARTGIPAGLAIAAVIGFTPENLAAAGVSVEQAATILQQLGASSLADEPLVKLLTSPSTVSAEIAPTINMSPTKLAELRQEAMEVVDISSQSDVGRKLTACIKAANRAVPAELKVEERTEEQWRELELAVVAERRAQRLGRAVPTEVATTLSAARGDSDVVAAKTGLQTRSDAIEDVFKGE